MNIEEIKNNAPDGANYYKQWKYSSIDYIKRDREGLYSLWYRNSWAPLPYNYFSKPSELKPL